LLIQHQKDRNEEGVKISIAFAEQHVVQAAKSVPPYELFRVHKLLGQAYGSLAAIQTSEPARQEALKKAVHYFDLFLSASTMECTREEVKMALEFLRKHNT